MKELLITVFCPPVSKSYDFWIPGGMRVKTAIALLCDDICAFENNPHIFCDREALLLCSYLEMKTLPMELSLEQAGIKGGDRLALL